MRINKFISLSLGISRRQADKLITGGEILLNNSAARVRDEVSDKDQVIYKNNKLELPKKLIYILMNKPVGYVCSQNGQGSHTIYRLLPKHYQHLKNVGRLDKDTSGLILLTNDGDLHFELTHPKFHKLKVYQVVLDKPLTQDDLLKISNNGIPLEDGLSKFKIEAKNEDLQVHIYEGRNRQIRRTFEALGYKVNTLHRTQFGPYKLVNLKLGAYKVDIRR